MKKIRKLFGVTFIIMALLVMQLPMPEAGAKAVASGFSVKGTTLLSYKGKEKVITIPDDIETIATDAFKNNTNVQEIRFGKKVSKIEPYAFWGCSKLDTVVLNDGLKNIGDFAFANCKAIQQFTVPDSVTSIGIYSFQDDVNMTDITIPFRCMSIHESAFDGCYKLVIHAPEGSYPYNYAQTFYIRQQDFPEYEDTENLPTGDSVDGNSTTGDGNSGNGSSDGGTGNSSSSSVSDNDVPGRELGSVRVVGYSAVVFMDGTSSNVYTAGNPFIGGSSDVGLNPNELKPSNGLPKYTIVDGQIVADQAYYGKKNLDQVTLPETISEIGQFAYARSSVKNINIPNGTEKISYGAFYHCDDLASVSLPESIMLVEPKAFEHTGWLDSFFYGASGEGDFLISGGVLVAYRGSSDQVIIPDSVRVIAADVFKDHSEIAAVSLPSSLRVIGEGAFEGCSSLNQILFREAKDINSLAEDSSTGVISGAQAMQVITQSSKGLEKICDRAFYGTKISSIVLPVTVSELGLNVFPAGAEVHLNGEGSSITNTHEVSAERLSNEEYRGLTNIQNLLVPDQSTSTEGENVAIEDTGASAASSTGVVLVSGDSEVKALLDGADRTYTLSAFQVDEDTKLEKAIARADSILPAVVKANTKTIYNFALTDESSIPITKLGKQALTIAIPVERLNRISYGGTLTGVKPGSDNSVVLAETKVDGGDHVWGVLTVDRNGQLELLEGLPLRLGEKDYIAFSTYHLTPFALYDTGEIAMENSKLPGLNTPDGSNVTTEGQSMDAVESTALPDTDTETGHGQEIGLKNPSDTTSEAVVYTQNDQLIAMSAYYGGNLNSDGTLITGAGTGTLSDGTYDGNIPGMVRSIREASLVEWMRSFGYKVMIAGAMLLTGLVLVIWKKRI